MTNAPLRHEIGPSSDTEGGVTAEMIEAGVRELCQTWSEPTEDEMHTIVRKIFTAMTLAGRKCHPEIF
jgi:hypothetical protein